MKLCKFSLVTLPAAFSLASGKVTPYFGKAGVKIEFSVAVIFILSARLFIRSSHLYNMNNLLYVVFKWGRKVSDGNGSDGCNAVAVAVANVDDKVDGDVNSLAAG